MVTSSIANIASKMADSYGYDDEDFEEPLASEESSKFPSARQYNDRATSLIQKTKKKAQTSRLSLPPPAIRKSPQTSPRDRVLSSTRHELRSMQNRLADVERQLNESVRENKLLKRLQARQERDLGKMQQQESELPQILQRHSEEVRAVREQLRRSQGKNTELRKMVNSLREKVSKEESEHKQMEKLIRKKGLKERELLTWQLQTANEKMAEQEKREKELERAIEVTSKAHSQEMKTALGKYRQSTRELDEVQKSVRKLKWQLKEKEKEVQVMNIYSQRIQQTMPRQLPSSLVRPMCDDMLTQTTLTYPPKSTISLSITTITSTTGTQTLEDNTTATKLVTESPVRYTTTTTSVSTALRMSFERSTPQSTVTYAITEATPTLTFATPIVPATNETIPTIAPSFTQTTPSAAVPHLTQVTPPQAQLTNIQPAPASIQTPPTSTPVSSIQAPPTSTPVSIQALPSSTQAASASIQAPPTYAVPVSTQAPPIVTAPIQTPPTSTFTVNSSSEPARKPQVQADRSDLLKTLFGSSATPTGASSSSNQPLATERERRPSQAHSERSQSNTPSLDAEARKKELLNILFADSSAQQQSTTSSTTTQSIAQKRSDAMKDRDSSTSITSWSDKLQNLHEGKPAFATDQDPYGSQALGRKESRTFLTDLQSRTNSGETQHKPRHGRRAAQQNDKSTVQSLGERKNKEITGLKPAASDVIGGYQPSVGAAGGKPRRHSEAVRGTTATGNSDTANVFDFSRGAVRLLQEFRQEGATNGDTQPHSSRALNLQNGRSSASIGVLAMDDDIEELVI